MVVSNACLVGLKDLRAAHNVECPPIGAGAGTHELYLLTALHCDA